MASDNFASGENLPGERHLRRAAYGLTILAGLAFPHISEKKAQAEPPQMTADVSAPAIITAKDRIALQREIEAIVRDSKLSATEQAGQLVPKLAAYRLAVRSAVDMTGEEFNEAARLSISGLNVTRFSSDIPRPLMLTFLVSNVLELHGELIARGKTIEGVDDTRKSLANDLLWSAAHHPKDEKGPFGAVIWDAAAEVYCDRWFQNVPRDLPQYSKVLSYWSGGNAVTARVLVTTSGAVKEAMQNVWKQIESGTPTLSAEKLEALLTLRTLIIANAAAGSYGLQPEQGEMLRQWAAEDGIEGTGRRFVALLLMTHRQSSDAALPHVEALSDDLKRIANDSDLLSGYLGALDERLTTNDISAADRGFLYKTLSLADLGDCGRELGAQWLRTRLLREEHAGQVMEELGATIAALAVDEVLADESGRKDRSLEALRAVASGERVRSDGDTGPGLSLALDILQNGMNGYSFGRFTGKLPADRAGAIAQIEAARTKCLIASCGILRMLDVLNTGDEERKPAEWVNFISYTRVVDAAAAERAASIKELQEVAPRLSSRLGRFEGYGLSDDAIAAGVVGLLEESHSRVDQMAEAHSLLKGKLGELRGSLALSLDGGGEGVFTREYENTRAFLYSQVFHNLPAYVAPSAKGEALSGLARKATDLEREIVAYKIIRLLAGDESERVSSVISRGTSRTAVKQACITIIEELGLLHAEMRHELQKTDPAQFTARVGDLITQAEAERLRVGREIWSYHPEFKGR